jgi:hypothetical protein
MKSDVELEMLTRKVDQLLGRIESLQLRLGALENNASTERKEAIKRRTLQEEMWIKKS